MILQTIKEMYNVSNADLAKIMKCTEKRVEKLLNHDAELMVDDLLRLQNHYQLSRDAFNLVAYQGKEDNNVYYQKHGKKEPGKL